MPGNPIGVQPQLAGSLERGAAGRRTLAGYLFLLPNFSGFLLFLLLPILFSLVLSFCEWNLLTWPPRFIGLQNYGNLVADWKPSGTTCSTPLSSCWAFRSASSAR